MTVSAAKYKPRPISQRDTLLARDGVDDCLVVSTTYLAASATLGEIFIHPNGLQMGRRARTALAKRARRSLGPSFSTGSLNVAAATPQMLKYLVPDAPVLRAVALDFATLCEMLSNGHCAILGGNSAHITGQSPLKRTGDVGHGIYLHTKKSERILVGDPYKPYSPRFGEWVPASDVRQFAFKSSDKTLTACFVIGRGEWTAERLVEQKMGAILRVRDANIKTLKRRLRDTEEELADCREAADCDAVRIATLDQAVAAIEALRDDAA